MVGGRLAALRRVAAKIWSRRAVLWVVQRRPGLLVRGVFDVWTWPACVCEVRVVDDGEAAVSVGWADGDYCEGWGWVSGV